MTVAVRSNAVDNPQDRPATITDSDNRIHKCVCRVRATTGDAQARQHGITFTSSASHSNGDPMSPAVC